MIKRILGTLLALAGALGILLSVLGVVYLWRAAGSVTAAADETLGLLSDTLDNVERSFDVASTTLDDAAVAVGALHTTTLGLGETLSSTQPTLGEMAILVEDDLPQSIESTLATLEVVEETAGVVDQTLRGLSLLGLAAYDPDVPLDQAVAATGEGLGPVPGNLREVGEGLRRTSASLDRVQDDIAGMGDHILDIREDVTSANVVIRGYVDIVQRLQERVQALRQGVGESLRVVAWGATLLLAWIGLSQLALIQWGVSLWRSR